MNLSERVSAITGQDVIALAEIPGAGGYSQASRRIATLADGSTVFVKAAVDDATASWVQAEHAAYRALGPQHFLAAYLGGDDALLVLEDLREGHWPPPWRHGEVDQVFALLDEFAVLAAPSGTRLLNDARGDLVVLWSAVGEDPGPLLRLGLCSSDWLQTAIPVLVTAASNADLDGDSIVHYDVRSDNLCFVDGRTVLVDWNLFCQGNSEFDRIAFAQTVTTEGGPAPWELLPDADAALIAVVAGFFADRAPGPPIPTAPRVRQVQLAQLRVCLPWAARVLDLPPPTG